MMVQFGFYDHARSRRSRAITAIVDLPKPLPTGHSLFNPAPPVAQLLPVALFAPVTGSSKSLKPVGHLPHLPRVHGVLYGGDLCAFMKVILPMTWNNQETHRRSLLLPGGSRFTNYGQRSRFWPEERQKHGRQPRRKQKVPSAV